MLKEFFFVVLTIGKEGEMEEEEEDKILLSSLGVTSANPEDIERDVLDQVCLCIGWIVLVCKMLGDKNVD